MDVNELEGAELDQAVALADGAQEQGGYWCVVDTDSATLVPMITVELWSPSTKWEHGGPIIERERIALGYYESLGEWAAYPDGKIVSFSSDETIVANLCETGPTPLVAAMRAFVAARQKP